MGTETVEPIWHENTPEHTRHLPPRLGASALVLGVVLIGAVPADAASGGSISGTVVAATDGTPLAGICVNVSNGPGTVTGADGTYSIDGVDAGTHTVQYSDCNADPTYTTQWYLGHIDQSSAGPVNVIDGSDTALSDVHLTAGVTVSGTVTDTDGNPLAGINVWVNSTGSAPGTGTTTGTDGTYVTSPLTPGDYKVQFSDSGSGDPGWARQYWNGAVSSNTASTLTLSTSDVPSHSGVDTHLTSGAKIEGTVTAAGGVPLSGVCVNVNVATGNGGSDWVNGAQTGADGTYTIPQLPATNLFVQFHDCADSQYVDQWYAGADAFRARRPCRRPPAARARAWTRS